jgi:hypothetical protein
MNKKVLRELIYTDVSEEAIPWLDGAKEAIDEALSTEDLEVRYDAIIRARDMLEEAEVITHDQVHM